MDQPTQAAVFCGGIGTRLRPLTDTLPKPMAPIHDGKPFLHFLLDQLSEQGIRRFVLMTGYLADVISDYFGDGSQWGWDIIYSRGPVEWDTGRRLWEAHALLDERFLLLYSDNFAQFSLQSAFALHQNTNAAITLMVKKKASGNVSLGAGGTLERYESSRKGEGLDHVELGYMIVERKVVLSAFEELGADRDISFSEVIRHLVAAGMVHGYELQTPYYSISDLDRLALMRKHLSPRRLLLIDRDGTLHHRAPRGEYIRLREDMRFLPEAITGLKRLAAAGFNFIVISNQAGIGRGAVTQDEVDAVNAAVAEELKREGVEILAFYVCPHHWIDECACRKPRPGLFFRCAADFDLRLDRTLYVGDDPRDMEAADAAGCGGLYVGDADELRASRFHGQRVYSSINEATEDIISAFTAWE